MGAGVKHTMKITKRQERQPEARAIERDVIVPGRRMAPAEEREHRDEQASPDHPRRRVETQAHRYRYRPDRDVEGTPSEHGVGDVPAVELADREQIERRHEQPDPRREGHRVEIERQVAGDGPPHQPLRGLVEQRFAKLGAPEHRRQRRDVRHREADEQRRHRHEESRERARHPHIEDLGLCRQRLADPDHGAKRPEVPEWHRQKVREGRADPIVAARKVVAELVRRQYRQQGHREPEPLNRQGSHAGHHPPVAELRHEAEPVRGADESGGHERQQEEQDVEPGTVRAGLEVAAAPPRATRQRVQSAKQGIRGTAGNQTRCLRTAFTVVSPGSGGPCPA